MCTLRSFTLLPVFGLALMAGAPPVSKDAVEAVKRSTQLQLEGRYDEAEAVVKDVLPGVKDDPESTAMTLNELCLGYAGRDRHADAERCYRDALRRLKDVSGDRVKIIRTRLQMNLAALYIETDRIAQAERLAREVEEPLATRADLMQWRNLLAAMALAKADYTEAQTRYVDNLAFMRAPEHGPAPVEIATALNNLGAIALRTRQWAPALQYLSESVDAWRKAVGPTHPNLVKCLANLGYVQQQLRQYAAAAKTLGEASELTDPVLGATHPLSISIHLFYADVLSRVGRKAEAKALKKATEQTMALAEKPESRATIDYSELLSLRDRKR